MSVHPMISVSIIIPAYNEEEIIENAILQALQVSGRFPVTSEVIVINDGSRDKTGDIIDCVHRNYPAVRIIHKNRNEGFGSAIKQGIALSQHEYILCVPADSPLTEELLTGIMENAEKADILVTYRKEKVGYGILKKINSQVYHFLISTLFGMRLRDYNWIHIYNRRIFKNPAVSIQSKGIFMLAEILIKAKRAGCTFYEFEVEQRQRLTGIATASRPMAILKTLYEVLSFRFKRNNR